MTTDSSSPDEEEARLEEIQAFLAHMHQRASELKSTFVLAKSELERILELADVGFNHQLVTYAKRRANAQLRPVA